MKRTVYKRKHCLHAIEFNIRTFGDRNKYSKKENIVDPYFDGWTARENKNPCVLTSRNYSRYKSRDQENERLFVLGYKDCCFYLLWKYGIKTVVEEKTTGITIQIPAKMQTKCKQTPKKNITVAIKRCKPPKQQKEKKPSKTDLNWRLKKQKAVRERKKALGICVSC